MNEYDDLLTYWFPSYTSIPKFWFDKKKETDEYITLNFSSLLSKAENHQLNHWKSTVKGHLALIILLDQFSRHIYRDTSDQYKNDLIAYMYSKEFLLYNKDVELEDIELMMVLMPFRHQENIKIYEFLVNYIRDKDNILWNNFKYHTNYNYEYLKQNNKLPDRDHSYIIPWNKFDDILEHKWDITMQNYDINSNLTDTLTTYLNNNIIANKNNIIMVSLSGGVDSMVILYILSQIKNNYPNLKILAIHIDYHNRPETGLEAEFIFNYCKVMKIPLYYRYIHEAMRERNSKKREEYEELTKDIRFDLYKRVENIYKKNYNILGVILGHHKGDLQENIFQNVMKGRNLTDLSVIKEQSEILGVKILRLLIRHPKSDIFQMAHKNNIPYFKNTTPEWSNRGNMREIIIPSLIKTFGQGVLTNLSKIGQESDELQLILKQNIIKPYMENIHIIDNIHYLPITLNQSFTYWKYILHEWCHMNKLPIISYKLIGQIYEKIYTSNKVTITCNSKLSILINNPYLIINVFI
jgi:tRNA(Ile)-lysidine synthetase-like protein